MKWSRVALIVYLAIVTVGVILLAREEGQVEQRLGPEDKVSVVGPCRTFGPDNKECRRQSRRIIRSCLTHEDCLTLVFRLTDRAERQGIIEGERTRDDAAQGTGPGGQADTPSASGPTASVVAPTPTSPSSTVPPPDNTSAPGGTGSEGPGDGGGGDPQTPPASPGDAPTEPDSVLESVDGTVQETCDQLGVSVPGVC